MKLRGIMQALQEAMKCPVCGKSRLVVATGWKGHGTGQHGSTHYNATAHEQVRVETHCTCPGGVVETANAA